MPRTAWRMLPPSGCASGSCRRQAGSISAAVPEERCPASFNRSVLGTAAEMLLLVGDNPERIHSEAAFAKLCGACPIPASSGKTIRYRLNRGGNRQANAALYRVVITRMRGHQPTLDYVRRRTAEGKSRSEIIRCLERYVAGRSLDMHQPR